uniref:Uncharacterized protein n=1 Tax=Lepeophtheirus salmonis TaxID=72036 RepID=A0A0K2V8X7_LEPSM
MLCVCLKYLRMPFSYHPLILNLCCLKYVFDYLKNCLNLLRYIFFFFLKKCRCNQNYISCMRRH